MVIAPFLSQYLACLVVLVVQMTVTGDAAPPG